MTAFFPSLTAKVGGCVLLLAAALTLTSPQVAAGRRQQVHSRSWQVQLHRPDEQQAKLVAARNGFEYRGRVPGTSSHFHLQHPGVPEVAKRASHRHTQLLEADPLVRKAQQEPAYRRVKRGFKPVPGAAVAQTVDVPRERGKPSEIPNDPLYAKEWYINNTGQAGGVAKLDLNVEAAWSLGFTGKNVTTAIMDDGVDYMHPDLFDNFNAEASYDFSSNDRYPYPRYTDDWFNSHGTRCAGEIAAIRDNGICGLGVAYDSKIAGLRMLDQPYMTDLIEANSMGHRPDLIDIYSASWGPTDDGKTVDGPRQATIRSIVDGVNKGRGGKGSIYVWASGDGGPDDDCNCDGYAASMWTISINSATNDGQTAGYDESCSSTLASTFSNGKSGMQDAGVASTDLYGKCTTRHSGTSAAAPEAAGVFALALEANRNLTWRDIQHLTVLSSKRNHLFDPKGEHNWTINGAGIEFNHLFGYGVLDAGDMVQMAKHWVTVPDRFHCTAGSVTGNYAFNTTQSFIMTIDTAACRGSADEVNFLEHVQSFVSLRASRRGDVTLYLVSPMNTTSMILSKRPKDDDVEDGFTKWPFMTTHTWAESPRGLWKLFVIFDSQVAQSGELFEWTLLLHGTKTSPYLRQRHARSHSKLDVVKREHRNSKLYRQ